MAKSKRTRRDRRLPSDSPVQSPVSPASKTPVAVQKTAAQAAPAAAVRSTVDFTKEYYYVYAELRQIFLVTIFMFAVMIGLSFVI
ncbi:MAG: hypothetical protein H6631_01310 [Anaerolineaceae bacterium]|nr:hypothetical protein [Anaerolineaceae bacterium]